MSSPRYIPRTFTLDSLDFGRVKLLRWRRPEDLDGTELDQLAASRFQHELALVINEAIARRHVSRESYADATHINAARLGRMLRGEVPMRLDDMAQAQRRLGIDLMVLVAAVGP